MECREYTPNQAESDDINIRSYKSVHQAHRKPETRDLIQATMVNFPIDLNQYKKLRLSSFSGPLSLNSHID